jgi:hypothetical protein
MKKSLFYWYSFLFILLVFSCKSKQIIHDTVVEKHIFFMQKDSTKTIDKSLAINDSLILVIGDLVTGKKECDSLCAIQVNNLLSKLNAKKTSGKNEFGVFYDKKTKSIKAYGNVGETKTETTTKNETIVASQTKDVHKEVPVVVPFSKEQNFNIWTGRVFWFLLLFFIAYKIIKWTKSIIPGP